MTTILAIQIALFVLCAVFLVVSLANYFRRRRARRAGDVIPPSFLSLTNFIRNRRAKNQLSERWPKSLPMQTSIVEAPHLSIVKPGIAESLSSNNATSTDGSAVPQPQKYAATTWQDRNLFSSPLQSGWRGHSAIPPLDAKDVPHVDNRDFAFGPATPVLASFLPETEDSKKALARELKQAGDYAPHAYENLASKRFLFMIGSLLFGGLAVVLAPRLLERPLLIGTVALTALGWAVPALLVRSRAKSRRTEIELAIPDMMDMLNMCVSQGLTVPDSVARVARDLKSVYPALAQELAIVVDQTQVGTMNEAFTNFAERVDIPQVESFVSLITQTERMGTSVSDALTEYSDNMRESLRQRADERANQASFSLLFPTVLFLMPAVFLFLMGPAIIEMAKFTNAGGLAGLGQGRNVLRNLNQQEIRSGRGANGGANR